MAAGTDELGKKFNILSDFDVFWSIVKTITILQLLNILLWA